jgi:uncharacterized glyoxalase superfamily protein PhnB
MAKVTGVGGVFFKARDPKKLMEWYMKHLGFEQSFEGGTVFLCGNGPANSTTWSPFPESTKYFEPGTASFMINYRVDNLRELLDQLKKEGIEEVRPSEEHEYGKFGWILDPEGNCLELWEPAEGQ